MRLIFIHDINNWHGNKSTYTFIAIYILNNARLSRVCVESVIATMTATEMKQVNDNDNGIFLKMLIFMNQRRIN